MKKQRFFAGLWGNYKYLVSHLKDQDNVDLVLMLKEIRECDESRYLASTSNPPKSTGDGPVKNTNYYDKKNYDQWGYGNYTARAANIQTKSLIPCRRMPVRGRMMMYNRTGHIM